MKIIKWLLNHPVVFIVILLGISILCIIYLLNSNAKYKELYNRELQNVIAYQQENSNLSQNAVEYQMTIGQLKGSVDSIDIKILEAVKDTKIKEKEITKIQYQDREVIKTDTVLLEDTIFVDSTHIDTTLCDEWYKLNLKLDYPSRIIASPTFKSEQYVIFHNVKKYVNKRSKWFFIRWFQKKYWTTEITLIEKSPYITDKEKKFINIVK